MNLELTDEQAAALLKELNEIIDGDRYFMSDRIKTLKGDPRQDLAGAGPRAAAAAETVRPAAGERGTETARTALNLAKTKGDYPKDRGLPLSARRS